MEANLENAIQQKVHALSEDQQREVLNFVEQLVRPESERPAPSYSFIGIAHSGKGDLSQRAEEILETEIDRREGWSHRD